jgi:hypothetical protein
LIVLIAPDSFKGSLTSVQVARAIAGGWRNARPDDTIRLAPLADGGEGTLDAIEAAGGWTRRSGARSRAPGSSDAGPTTSQRSSSSRPRLASRGSGPTSEIHSERPPVGPGS